MDAHQQNPPCPECGGPLRFDGTRVIDPHYMRGRQCFECWVYGLLPAEVRGLEWVISGDSPKTGVPWLDVKSPKLREQARLLPCARRPR